MEKSQSIQNIAKSLSQFHIKCDKIKKTADNPFFKSKYAPLPEILEAIQLPLSESGLTFAQFPDGDSLTTILMHIESGEWIQSSYNMHPAKSDPQSVGSAITYARRYALASILALNVDEDDDGNKASVPVQSSQQETPVKPWLNKNNSEYQNIQRMMKAAQDKDAAIRALRQTWSISKAMEAELRS